MSYLMPSQAGKAVSAQKTLYQTREENTKLREAIALAYGYLWHVNNEPGTPSQYPPERAAYEARKALRDLMTHEQRGEAINRVRELMGHNMEFSERAEGESAGRRVRLGDTMEPKKEYWLQSDPQQKGWGPFETEDAAWRYLFGRESNERDREQHKEAGWYVGYMNKWPNDQAKAQP